MQCVMINQLISPIAAARPDHSIPWAWVMLRDYVGLHRHISTADTVLDTATPTIHAPVHTDNVAVPLEKSLHSDFMGLRFKRTLPLELGRQK